jgi:hypothetical protein
MYNMNFCLKLGPNYLVKSPTMYDEVNLSIKMGPTYASGVVVYPHERGRRENLFSIALWIIHNLVGHP